MSQNADTGKIGIDIRVPALIVSEVFSTIQGEGATLGVPSTFVRLMGCNQKCTFCDTPYTWDPARFDLKTEGRRVPVVDLLQEVFAHKPTNVVISGGEPMLHQKNLEPFVAELRNRGYTIEVETAGTIAPTESFGKWIHRFNVSPKLSSSGNSLEVRYNTVALRLFRDYGKASFKFVVTRDLQEADLQEIDTIVSTNLLQPGRVYLMPEGTTPEQVLHADNLKLVAHAISRGYNVTTRLHVLLWGAKRGV